MKIESYNNTSSFAALNQNPFAMMTQSLTTSPMCKANLTCTDSILTTIHSKNHHLVSTLTDKKFERIIPGYVEKNETALKWGATFAGCFLLIGSAIYCYCRKNTVHKTRPLVPLTKITSGKSRDYREKETECRRGKSRSGKKSAYVKISGMSVIEKKASQKLLSYANDYFEHFNELSKLYRKNMTQNNSYYEKVLARAMQYSLLRLLEALYPAHDHHQVHSDTIDQFIIPSVVVDGIRTAIEQKTFEQDNHWVFNWHRDLRSAKLHDKIQYFTADMQDSPVDVLKLKNLMDSDHEVTDPHILYHRLQDEVNFVRQIYQDHSLPKLIRQKALSMCLFNMANCLKKLKSTFDLADFDTRRVFSNLIHLGDVILHFDRHLDNQSQVDERNLKTFIYCFDEVVAKIKYLSRFDLKETMRMAMQTQTGFSSSEDEDFIDPEDNSDDLSDNEGVPFAMRES